MLPEAQRTQGTPLGLLGGGGDTESLENARRPCPAWRWKALPKEALRFRGGLDVTRPTEGSATITLI